MNLRLGVVIALLVLSIVSLSAISPGVLARKVSATFSVQQTSYQATGCSQQIDSKANAESTQFRASAVAMAENSSQFASLTRSYTTSLDSLFDNWSFDVSCNVTLTKVNVVFQIKNSSGSQGHAVFAEDPGLTRVIEVTLQQHNGAADTSTVWSGYDFYASADLTTKVYESIGDWSVPAVSKPNSTACSNSPQGCDVVVWDGITNDEFGNNGIAQTGSESHIVCSSTCSTTYDLWYQFCCSGQSGGSDTWTTCLTGVASSDSITSYVLNAGWNGGSESSWNVHISDTTLGQSCTVTGHSFTLSGGGHPWIANFIAERPYYVVSGVKYYATVPSFSQFSITGSMYYSGSTNGIYVPYGNGWYYLITMQNCSPLQTNVDAGSPGTTNSFAENYQNSKCT